MVLNNKHSELHILKISAVLILFMVGHQIAAQSVRSEAPPLRERIFYGGSFGLQIGTITNIEFAPVIGLWVLPRLNIAAGPNYRFYKDPLGRTDIFGGRVYTEFALIRDVNSIIPVGLNLGIFVHFEDEYLSLDPEFWQIQTSSARYNVNTLLIGPGISQPVGRRSSINMMVLWALNESEYDLYGNPEFRISVIF